MSSTYVVGIGNTVDFELAAVPDPIVGQLFLHFRLNYILVVPENPPYLIEAVLDLGSEGGLLQQREPRGGSRRRGRREHKPRSRRGRRRRELRTRRRSEARWWVDRGGEHVRGSC